MKKDIPLDLWKSLQPKIDENSSIIKQIIPKDKDVLIDLIDRDTRSNFFFRIKEIEGSEKYKVEFKPKNSTTTQNTSINLSIESIHSQFESWVSILKAYDSIKTIYDDPIVQEYQREFESEFEIIDNPDISFDLEKQLLLDAYLEKTLNQLEDFRGEQENLEIQEIIKDVADLKSSQTRLSKKEISRSLSKIWAKARKQGIDLLRTIYLEAGKELAKKMMNLLLEQ